MMRLFRLFAFVFCLAAVPPAVAQTILNRGSGFAAPAGVALDGAGNVFIADSLNNSVKEIPAEGGYSAVKTLAGAGSYGPSGDQAVAVDGQGNLFYGDTGAGTVYEALADGNFQTVKRLASGFVQLQGMALDAAGNVFVVSGGGASDGSGQISEIIAAGGYATVKTISSGFDFPAGIVVDPSENIFFSQGTGVYELEAASGYAKLVPILTGQYSITALGLALDAQGNVYVASAAIPGPAGPFGIVWEVFAAGGYANYQILSSDFMTAAAVVVDAAGNVFVADAGLRSAGSGNSGAAVKEIPAGGGAVVTLSTALPNVSSVALGPQGDLFIGSGSFAGVTELSVADNYAVSGQYLSNGFSEPQGVAVDGAGNVYVTDTYHGAVKEILAAGGYTSVQTLATGFIEPSSIAVDGAGDVFVIDPGSDAVKEIPAGGGAVKVLSRDFKEPTALAADSAGDVFVSDLFRGTVIELLAAGGYQDTVQIGPSGIFTNGLGLDGAGDLFLASFATATIDELQKSEGYQAATTVANGFAAPVGVAVDSAGDVFVADQGAAFVPEILAAPPTLFAAILPGSRSTVQPATVFATLINAGPAALTGCSVSLDLNDATLVSLGYQQTDPTDNTPVGTPNTPFTIPGNNGSVSLVLSFTDLIEIGEPALAPAFGCTDGTIRTAAPVIPGVSTLDLHMSSTPTPDIIALAATTGGGTLTILGSTGTGAFALASIDAGIAGTVTATPTPSDASLPLTLTICPTDPVTASCTTPSAGSAQLDYAASGTQTYSVFATAAKPIAFSPATARIFVHFTDANGDDVGSTSVAVQTQ